MGRVEVAMVLGAGRGTRLAALGLQVPKVLVDVAGRPLLERQMDLLAAQGLRKVVVNAHHLAEHIERFAAAHTTPPELEVVVEPQLLGTAGGVRNALPQLGDAPFMVLYGDVVVDEPLGPMLEAHDDGSVATLAVYETAEVEGKGLVEVDADDRITGFAEKAVSSLTTGTALVNAGIYVVSPELLADLPPDTELDFGHDVFPAALARGERLRVHRLQRPVIDVGTPEGLQRAEALVGGDG